MSWLTRLLRLSRTTNDQLSESAEQLEKGTEFLEEGAEKLGTATEFLENVADKLESADVCTLSEAIESALPWVETAADVVGDAIPPIKAVLKIVGFLTKETDPRALGLLAFSLAYQSALADAAAAIQNDPEAAKRIDRSVRLRGLRRLIGTQPDQLDSFENFTLRDRFRHPLIKRADESLMRLAEAAGWPQDLRIRLIEGVHRRFTPTFRKIIADGRTREKFDPLFKYLEIDATEESRFSAIERHVAYQLWCFNEAPALGKPQDVQRGEPMALACSLQNIYLPPDCGVLNWTEIEAMKASTRKHDPPRTPFQEPEGGRCPMLEQVIRLLGNRDFKDAIVIQGVAGAGKSAFTLRLCVELRRLGLRPVRIRMRHLLLDGRTSLFEDMAQAIAQNSGDQAFDRIAETAQPTAGDIDVGRLFDEMVAFGEAEICPHVVIFDGWDEISVSASEGFRKRIDDTLYKIRRQIIDHGRTCVRVVLTGRPSLDVQEVGFLLGETPVLTIRPLRGDQVEQFADALLDYYVETRSAHAAHSRLGSITFSSRLRVVIPRHQPARKEGGYLGYRCSRFSQYG
jgi:hypothetical protein